MAPAIVRLQMLAALREAWALRWPGLALGPATPDRGARPPGGHAPAFPRDWAWGLRWSGLALGPATPGRGARPPSGHASEVQWAHTWCEARDNGAALARAGARTCHARPVRPPARWACSKVIVGLCMVARVPGLLWVPTLTCIAVLLAGAGAWTYPA